MYIYIYIYIYLYICKFDESDECVASSSFLQQTVAVTQSNRVARDQELGIEHNLRYLHQVARRNFRVLDNL